MATDLSVGVRLLNARGDQSTGVATLRSWPKAERTLRAFKALGISWGLAVVSVILPLAHFFLVPLFLIAGPVAFYWIGSQRDLIIGGEGTCPGCAKTFTLARAPARWPIRDVCGHCHSEFEIAQA